MAENLASVVRHPQYRPEPKEYPIESKLKITSHPSSSNDCENHEGRHFEHKNMQTDDNNDLGRKKSSQKSENTEDDQNAEMVDVEIKNSSQKLKVYQGVLFVESLKSVKDDHSTSEYFITYHGFWNECQEMTDVSVNHVFNYLKVKISLEILI